MMVVKVDPDKLKRKKPDDGEGEEAVSYTHLRLGK